MPRLRPTDPGSRAMASSARTINVKARWSRRAIVRKGPDGALPSRHRVDETPHSAAWIPRRGRSVAAVFLFQSDGSFTGDVEVLAERIECIGGQALSRTRLRLHESCGLMALDVGSLLTKVQQEPELNAGIGGRRLDVMGLREIN